MTETSSTPENGHGQDPNFEKELQDRLEQQRRKVEALSKSSAGLKGTSLERVPGPVHMPEDHSRSIWGLAAIAGLLVLAFIGFNVWSAYSQPKKPATAFQVTVYQTFTSSSLEEKALEQIIQNYEKENPDVTVNALEVPFAQGFIKWETEMSTGSGPDVIIYTNDRLSSEAQGGMLLPLDDAFQSTLKNISPAALQGMSVDGKLYGTPLFFQSEGLYYRTQAIDTPPKTTDELLAMVRSGKKLVLLEDSQSLYGFLSAFGAGVDASAACTGGEQAYAAAAQYLLDLKNAGALVDNDYAIATSQFTEGKADMIVDGPWMLTTYENALNGLVGVVPIPSGTSQSRALMNMWGAYINASTKNRQQAEKFVSYLAEEAAQKTFADIALEPPVNTTVQPVNQSVATFMQIGAAAEPPLPVNWFGGYQDLANSMFMNVLERGKSPAGEAKNMCETLTKVGK